MAAGPLAPPHSGGLTAGDRLLVFYDGDVVWHTRLLLAHVHQSTWVILTPDGDIYAEDVSDANPDWDAWRVWPRGGGAPFGVDPNLIYPFNPEPGGPVLHQLFAEGEHHARQERLRMGAAAPAAVVAGVAGAAGAPVAPVVGAAAGGVANLAGGGGGALVPVAGAAAPVGGGGGGHAGLAAALNAGGAVANPNAVVQGGEDARTLSISRDPDGLRYKEFRTAVLESKQTDFQDWPVSGPRTVKYVLGQMLDHGGSALGHHQAWRVACKLQPTDAPAMEHEAWSKVLQTLMTYDQVDVTNLAGAEMICRNLQRIEERHKFKLASVDDAGEGALFMGSTTGVRAGSIICPRLTEWIGSEMQKEAMVAKERRKAREERALARKGDKDSAAK